MRSLRWLLFHVFLFHVYKLCLFMLLISTNHVDPYLFVFTIFPTVWLKGHITGILHDFLRGPPTYPLLQNSEFQALGTVYIYIYIYQLDQKTKKFYDFKKKLRF